MQASEDDAAKSTTTQQHRIWRVLNHLVLSRPFQFSIEHKGLRVSLSNGGEKIAKNNVNITGTRQQQPTENIKTNNAPSNGNNNATNSTTTTTPINPTPTITTAPPTLDSIHEQIQQSKQYEQARQGIFQLLPFLPNDLQEAQSQMRRAYRLMALSYYKADLFEPALPWFYKAAQGSQQPQDWFNVASCAAQVPQHVANKLSMAISSMSYVEQLYKTQLQPNEQQQQALPSFWMQYYWFTLALMNGKHDQEASKCLARLARAYRRARFTDAEFLQEIGLPELDQFVQCVCNLYKRNLHMTQLVNMLEQMQHELDDHGKQFIQKALADMK